MRRRLREPDELDDPILSVVNLIDVFLVVIAALLLAMAQAPVNPFAEGTLTVIRNAGRPDMEIVVRDGRRMERYRAGGSVGRGEGVIAGTAYRMDDGSMIYVPDDGGQ